MTTETLEAGRPEALGSFRTPDAALPHPVVLASMSAVLLWLSFPPAEWSWGAWFALVPLLLLARSRRSVRSVYFGSWVGGFVFWLLAVHWVWWADETAWLGWVVMASFLSLWWPAFLFLARFSSRRLNLPLIVAAPVLWVALEYVRAYALTGFPWYYLAHSQYRNLYITQIADFSGSLGVSFLIATVNVVWVDLLTLPLFRAGASGSFFRKLAAPQKARLLTVGLAVAATLGYGAYRVSSAKFRAGPRLALIQTNEVNEYNTERKQSKAALEAKILALVNTARRAIPAPDLIVWPETMNPWGFVSIDPKLDRATLDRIVKALDPTETAEDWLGMRDVLVDHFNELVLQAGIPMMIGSSIHEFFATGHSKYNAAILFQARKAIQVYRKLHLVPFGEYVPLLKSLPWLIRLTPYRDANVSFLDPGAEPSWFDLGSYRIAAAICFEDTLPHVVRRSFAEAPDGREPDLLINLSNDGWFHETSEHEMHLAISTFRCIENRVPLARAVNTGISAMIDGNGRIVAELGKQKSGVLAEVAPLDDRTSSYSRWGDWLGVSCLAATLGLLVLGTCSPRGRRAEATAALA